MRPGRSKQSCWRVTWDESRVESRVMRVESESSHESLGSVLESSQVTSHRGFESSRVESSHTKLSSHARVRHYIQYSALLLLVDGDAILLASYKINLNPPTWGQIDPRRPYHGCQTCIFYCHVSCFRYSFWGHLGYMNTKFHNISMNGYGGISQTFYTLIG